MLKKIFDYFAKLKFEKREATLTSYVYTYTKKMMVEGTIGSPIHSSYGPPRRTLVAADGTINTYIEAIKNKQGYEIYQHSLSSIAAPGHSTAEKSKKIRLSENSKTTFTKKEAISFLKRKEIALECESFFPLAEQPRKNLDYHYSQAQHGPEPMFLIRV